MTSPTSFAQRLQAVREGKGLSQYALAKLSGLSKQTVSSLEMGTHEPSWDTVQRLALALGVDCRSFADPSITLPEQPAEPAQRGRPPKDKPAEAGPKRPRGRPRKEKRGD
jgi:transcriptional regulator with XRE-family HTH domain